MTRREEQLVLGTINRSSSHPLRHIPHVMKMWLQQYIKAHGFFSPRNPQLWHFVQTSLRDSILTAPKLPKSEPKINKKFAKISAMSNQEEIFFGAEN